MYGFLNDIGNYDQRKVGRDDFDWGFVSTARVSDGRKPYETAVKHAKYGDGEMVIVECYDSKKEASEGHAKWLAAMTADVLPSKLTDCANSDVSQLLEVVAKDQSWKDKNLSP